MADDTREVRTEPNEPQPLCPSCMAEVEAGAHVCKECGAPLDLFATTDPLETIRSQGWAYRRAASGRRSGIVLLGMWLIFGALAVSTILVLLDILASVLVALQVVVGVAVLLPLLALYVLILRKCTIRRCLISS